MTGRPKGAFALVLHAHLPYVLSHGRWPHGTDWLNEAAAETYVPLLTMLHGIAAAGGSPKITIGITPVLTEQLAHPDFRSEFRAYLAHRIRAARADQEEFSKYGRDGMRVTAQRWEACFRAVAHQFEEVFHGDLVGAFRSLQDAGHIEIITCAATHGYLPLLGLDTSVQAQIRLGVETCRSHYGRPPRGIWLPECAYRPSYAWTPPSGAVDGMPETVRRGVEEILGENDLDYFIIDSAMLRGGKPIGVYIDRFDALKRLWKQFADQSSIRSVDAARTPRELYYVSSRGREPNPVAVFTRDPETGLQVWSGDHGYPGEPYYLDFHKKRFPGGLRYWRVTSAGSDLGDKAEYEPDRVEERVQAHAEHFCGLVRRLLLEHYEATGRPGIVCAPYDAELFGHWWFEGVDWLKAVLRRLEGDPDIALTTCGDYLDAAPPRQAVSLPEGSWGEGGYHYIWLNEWTAWTWKHIYADEVRMQRLARRAAASSNETCRRLAVQAARELLLLEASDWQFLISTVSARDYAESRVAEHHQAFTTLAAAAERCAGTGEVDAGDRRFLLDTEARDGLFPDIDLGWFVA